MGLERYLRESKPRVEAHLERSLPPAEAHPPRIHEAIRYAALGGGKRLRAMLVLLATELVGHPAEQVMDAAVALELIHTSTLLLDDLPAMDDARLRRGRVATHVAYGESTAILASVALLVHAFDLIAGSGEKGRGRKERVARAVHETALATGTVGLVGGQYLDLEVAGRRVDLRTLEYIHSHKTGQLFVLAATLGPTLVGAAEEDIEALNRYARNLGLAYQIVDDLLDREATSDETGKDQGQDEDRFTFASLVSPDEARALVHDLVEVAKAWVRPFGRRAGLLLEFADLLETRRA